MKTLSIFRNNLWLLSTFAFFGLASAVCSLTNDQNAVYWSIFEDHKIDSVIGILPISGHAVDYVDESRTINLRLISGEEFVKLDSATKQLVLKQAIDRETNGPKIEVIIECSSALPDDDFQINITVHTNIKDVNDNAPEFPSDVLRIQVNEELPIGSVIYSSLKASDEDSSGPNSEISYYVMRNSLDEKNSLFAIPNPWIGEIVTKGRIDYEAERRFNATVMAMDNGKPRLNSTILFIVDVVDIDDQNPRFEYDQYSVIMNCSQTNRTLNVQPNTIKAYDQDTLNANVFYSLSGVHSDKFRINRDNGRLSSDYVFKEADFFLLTIHAAQTDKPERQATAVLVVKSSLPTNLRFSESKYSVDIQETARIGQEILKTKILGKSSNTMAHFLLDDQSGKFTVEEDTGVIRLKQNLDYEQRKHYNLSCRVFDGLKVAFAQIEIHVMDVNESPPTFESREYVFKPNTTDDGSFVGQIRVNYDMIILNFHLLNQLIFRLNETGAIFIVNGASIRNTSYVMGISAADNGRPSKHSRCTVSVDFSNAFTSKFEQTWTSSSVFSVYALDSAVLWGTLACIFLSIFVISSVIIIILARKRREVLKSMVNSTDPRSSNNTVVYGISPSLAYGCPLGGSLAANHLRSIISNEDAFLNFGHKPPLFSDMSNSIHRRNLVSSLMFDHSPPTVDQLAQVHPYITSSPPTIDGLQFDHRRFLPYRELHVVQNSRSIDGGDDHLGENRDIVGRTNSNEFSSFTVL